MSFEDALAELEGIVRRLEEGSGKLEEAIVAYERGVALSATATRSFRRPSHASRSIVLGRNGAVAAEPISFD